MKPPVHFDPSVEKLQPDEAEVIGQLNEQFHIIQETTAKDYGHAVRAVHAKAHGIARGTLTVKDGLPAELAQGLFATSGRYEAVIRISTNAGDILDDSIRLPRGLALKVLGVEGERLPGSESETTQDFILVDGPAFAAPDAKHFLSNLKLLSKTTDKAEGAKKVLSTVLRGAEAALEAVGGESAMLKQMGGAPQTHPLGDTYYSQTAYRYGDYIAKVALFPVSPGLTSLTDTPVNASGRPDALREVVDEAMISQGGTWELRVQLCRDLEAQPVEDPTVLWKEEEAPFVTVATLEVPPQSAWTHGASDATDGAVVYNIWHGLAAHRPIGNVNRARNETYKKAADFRGRTNGCPMHEPKALADLP